MKKYSWLPAIVVFCNLQISAQDGITTARWQSAKIVTDGNNNEWMKPFNLYDAESGLLFTMTNDSKALYLCFTAKDERKISKLMKAGWRIEISAKEKKKKFDAAIAFPAIQMINTPGKDQGIGQKESPDFRNDINLYKINLQAVKAEGFVSANGDIPLVTPDKINIGVGGDSTHQLTVELAIPLKELFPENNASLNEELTLAVTINALKRPAYHGDSDAGDSFNGTGTGRMGGVGRMGGGGRKNREDMTDRSQLFSKVSFKQKFRLTGQ